MPEQMHSEPRSPRPPRTAPTRRVGFFCMPGFARRATRRGLPCGSTALFSDTERGNIFDRSNATGEVKNSDTYKRLLSVPCQPYVNFGKQFCDIDRHHARASVSE